MAASDGEQPARLPNAPKEESTPVSRFPQFSRAGPPSMLSSRMTDIASEDGDAAQTTTTAGGGGPSRNPSGASRPGTARTGISSTRSPPPLRRGLPGARRGSGAATSVAGSVSTMMSNQRPASRSHVPSLTSHAFFHPMSSQKLQAQRGGPAARPTTATQQQASPGQEQPPANAAGEKPAAGEGRSTIPVPAPVPLPQPLSQLGVDDEGRPHSQGTDVTATTSPTRGHYASASLSESVRPLQNEKKHSGGLSLNVDGPKSYKNLGNIPHTPRSFRSSFLLPNNKAGNNQSSGAGGGGDAGENGCGRNMPGAEKLESAPSSPRMTKREGNERKSTTEKNYEYFEGNTVFCLGGRLQNSKHRPVNIGTGFCVVLPGLLFFIFGAPWIWRNISPAIPIIFAYVFCICISSFIHASGSDPGILPRRLHKNPPPDENEDPLRLGTPSTDWVLVKSWNTKKSGTAAAAAAAAAMEVPVKYCKTCEIWRPPRAHHCRLCDSCIETVDHHCVWINNCVGRRNYRQFFTFLVTATFGCAYLVAVSLAQILVYRSREGISFGQAVDHFRVPFALVFYCLVAILYPGALTGYHIFLMARGETTREFLNSRKLPVKDRYRAFTQGSWVSNWIVVLCRPKGPSYYGFQRGYERGDQRLGGRTDAVVGRSSRFFSARNGGGGGGGEDQGMEMQDVGLDGLARTKKGDGLFKGPVSWARSRFDTAGGGGGATPAV
ncbi:DHHC palmitoyltransferase-domain-containing protein [Apodospora peruviana]|uniref:Palmitoyltransferase n=1 Tax=Apodospora peruviana TaxID=516989 RepID=A0AAE0M602_9PEZI|nr:DHHC palmitoyltransferase-domain-containing protein [Apodospora peruviana]